jgi:hypothetical protein
MLGDFLRGSAAFLALGLTPVGAGVGAAVAVNATEETPVEETAKDNHGAYVRSKLDEGLRGRELAGAIHAEKGNKQAQRGKAVGRGRQGEPARGRSGSAPGRSR